MAQVDYFDSETGLYSGVRFEGPDVDVEANAPAGAVAMPACEFPHAMRLVKDTLVDYQPPPPDDGYDWDEKSRRWVLNDIAIERQARDRSIKARIEALEASQARALREFAIGRGTKKDGSDMSTAELREALMKIDDEIAALRSQLQP